jgi:hypothetical protein
MLGLPRAVQPPDVQNAPRPAHQAAAALTTPTGSLASPETGNLQNRFESQQRRY